MSAIARCLVLLAIGLAMLEQSQGQAPPAAVPSPAQANPLAGPPPIPPPTTDTWTTKTFELKYLDPEQVRRAFAGQSHVMEADRELKLLTVRGSAAFLKEIEETIKRLDVAPPIPANAQITVYLVAAAAQAPSGTAVPTELKSLTKELPDKLADMQMFRVREGQVGETSSTTAPNSTGVALDKIRVESTTVNAGPKGDIVSLNGLKVWINVPAADPSTGSTKSGRNEPDVILDLDVIPNEPIVVAKIGVEKPLAVVLRVGLIK
jgi:hypothetical protein